MQKYIQLSVVIWVSLFLVSCSSFQKRTPSSEVKSSRKRAVVRDIRRGSFQSDFEGTWMLSNVECPEGSRPPADIQKALDSPEEFAQIILSEGKLIIRAKMGGCTNDSEAEYKIHNSEIAVSPKRSIHRCEGEPDLVEGPQKTSMNNKILIRAISSGEHEFLVKDQGLCKNQKSGNTTLNGDLVLRRVPVG